jgi:putative DNA primase/helicase
MASAATLARNLDEHARYHNGNWHCACPLGCGYDVSLRDADDKLLACCFGGCEFHEIENALVEFGLYDDDTFEASHSVPGHQPDPRDRELKMDHARRLYEASVEDALVAVYLRSRDLAITSPVLRFLLQASHRIGVRLPAMIAPVTGVEGAVTGVHLTYLKADGSGLAFTKPDKTKGERDLRRQCEGVIAGGSIRLAPHNPDQELIIAEGVETTLAAMEWHRLPGWSAVYAGGLKTAQIPSEIRRILIVADHDESGCSQRNAVTASQRWKAEGRTVRIWMPDTLGDDANSFLIKKRRA